jgi:hypothetical protein
MRQHQQPLTHKNSRKRSKRLKHQLYDITNKALETDTAWYKEHFEGQKRLPRKYKKALKHELAVRYAVSYALLVLENLNSILDEPTA